MFRRIKLNNPKIKLTLDIALTIAFVASMEPRFTGEGWHEWLSLALGGAAIIHILLNWKWIVAVSRRFFGRVARQARINYMLNLLLFVSFFLTMVSGIIISKNLNTTQLLGISEAAAQDWKAIHKWIPNVTLLIIGAHLALHWRWIVVTSQRYFQGIRIRHRLQPRRTPELSTNSSALKAQN